METIYYSLDAKRLTVCAAARGQRASGGQETVCYAFLPRRSAPAARSAAGGKVVDINAYRRSIQPAEPAPPAPADRPRAPRRQRLLLAAELAATGAVVVLLAAVAVLFAL